MLLVRGRQTSGVVAGSIGVKTLCSVYRARAQRVQRHSNTVTEHNKEQYTLLYHYLKDSMAHSIEHAHKVQYMNNVLAILYNH